MSDIQRYSIAGCPIQGSLGEQYGYAHTTDYEGEWCKWEDVKELEAELDNMVGVGGELQDLVNKLESQIKNAKIRSIVDCVNEQADDGPLWFDCDIEYVRAELRRLHKVIEK